MALDGSAIQYQTKQELVVSRLRDAILAEEFEPGQWLRLRDLAQTFGTSTMPIREALQILASEGLVIVSPHRGAQVAPLTAEELEELYMARLGLEGLAARLGAANVDDQALGQMRDLLLVMYAAVVAGDTATFLQHDMEFHTILYRLCGRPRLIQRMENLYKLCYRYMRRARVSFADTEYTRHFHTDLFGALETRDSVRAEQIVRQDLEVTVAYMRQHILTAPPTPQDGAVIFSMTAGHRAKG